MTLHGASPRSTNNCYDMEQKLKKLLEAVEHEVMRKPSRKTLDRLSLLAGFQDWDQFLRNFKGNEATEGDTKETPSEPQV